MHSQLASERRPQWLLASVVSAVFALVLWNRLIGTVSLLAIGVHLARTRSTVRPKQAEHWAGRLRRSQCAELRGVAAHLGDRVRPDIEDVLERVVPMAVAQERRAAALGPEIASVHDAVSSSLPPEAT